MTVDARPRPTPDAPTRRDADGATLYTQVTAHFARLGDVTVSCMARARVPRRSGELRVSPIGSEPTTVYANGGVKVSVPTARVGVSSTTRRGQHVASAERPALVGLGSAGPSGSVTP